MPEDETGNDPFGSFRSESIFISLGRSLKKFWIERKKRMFIPPYRAKNIHWEITFRALGWSKETIQKFWIIFCRINRSRTGEITIIEFLNYFNLDRTQYVQKCFEYFDTTGGNDIDFLEFMVSIWNICTLDAQTLTNFTFDLYDLDSDGELTYPEIEKMVLELFGSTDNIKSMKSTECLQDLTIFAEERGGVITLDSFAYFVMNHSMLLFPIFQIQRVIQTKVMGMWYWSKETQRRNKMSRNSEQSLNPRHVQVLLRTYKTGSVAAILTHTGDPNVALKKWIENENVSNNIELPQSDGKINSQEGRKSFWGLASKVVSPKVPRSKNDMPQGRFANLMTSVISKSNSSGLKTAKNIVQATGVEDKSGNKRYLFAKSQRNEHEDYTEGKIKDKINVHQSVEKTRNYHTNSQHHEDKTDRPIVPADCMETDLEKKSLPQRKDDGRLSVNTSTTNPDVSFTTRNSNKGFNVLCKQKNKMSGPPIRTNTIIQNSMQHIPHRMSGPPIPETLPSKNVYYKKSLSEMQKRKTDPSKKSSDISKKRKKKRKSKKKEKRSSNYNGINSRPRNPGLAVFAESSSLSETQWLPPVKNGSNRYETGLYQKYDR